MEWAGWYLGLDLAILTEEMNYKPLTVKDAAKDLPLKWYEAHPVIGSKILTFHIEVENDDTVNLMISGNTWPYRGELEKIGVIGQRVEQNYFRFLRNIDCSSDEIKERVLALSEIFHNQNVRVIIDRPKNELSGSVATFFNDELPTFPQFHFVGWLNEWISSQNK